VSLSSYVRKLLARLSNIEAGSRYRKNLLQAHQTANFLTFCVVGN
jgi:hypothetical protein